MIISSHVPAGAAVGIAVRRPLPALAVGFVSHLVMDAMPHWGTGPGTEPEWMPIARKDGVAGLAAIAVLVASTPRERRLAVLAGITGACLPDTDKVGRYFVGRSPWPAGFDRFHEAIQNEARDRFPREVATAVALNLVSLAVLRSLRSRTPPSRGHDNPTKVYGRSTGAHAAAGYRPVDAAPTPVADAMAGSAPPA